MDMDAEQVKQRLEKLERIEQSYRSASAKYRENNRDTINSKRREKYNTITKHDETAKARINELARASYQRKKERQTQQK